MNEAKARSNLFNLPPELRNRIFEFAVCPDKGEGGVEGESGICIQTVTCFKKPKSVPGAAAGFISPRLVTYGVLTPWRAPALSHPSPECVASFGKKRSRCTTLSTLSWHTLGTAFT